MKYLLIAVILCSCGSNITPKKWRDAKEACKKYGGIHYVDPSPKISVVCKIRGHRKHIILE